MLIYLVMGSTGEYSDRSEWIVAAYNDEVMAKQHVLAADGRAKEIYAEAMRISNENNKGRSYNLPDGEYRRNNKNEFDPEHRMDYTGNSYWLETVELRTSLPTGAEKYTWN